jgi:nitroimidazol reductase NimA-like FMN-containing flavoprotein (pyridoxamine 5'-phosphate oxidase superfamily)
MGAGTEEVMEKKIEDRFIKEKEITKRPEVEAVIHKSLVCRLGLSDNDMPYIVPLCFGYRDRTVYLHGSLEGRKMDILRKNRNVCLEFDVDTEIIESENACEWGMKFRSAIGFGKAVFLEDPDDKRKALDIILSHYSDKPFRYPEKAISGTAVIKIEISSITGKRSGFE